MRKKLNRQEEISLAREWKLKGDRIALDKLVEAYQPLIINISGRYVRGNIQRSDLIQEGVIGFISGLENFSPELGYGVGTLTRFHIESHMQMHVAEFGGTIRLPKSRRIKNLMSRVVGSIRMLENVHGRTLSQEEKARLCERHGFDLTELEELQAVLAPYKSISGGFTDDDEWGVTIASTSTGEQEATKNLDTERAAKAIQNAMRHLDERARYIIARRHFGDDCLSYKALGAELGISGERVRRVEENARNILRERLQMAGITGADSFGL
jgi:RNA polymerase sigma factor (sigma-70 family)